MATCWRASLARIGYAAKALEPGIQAPVDTSVPSGLRSVPSAFCSWTPVKRTPHRTRGQSSLRSPVPPVPDFTGRNPAPAAWLPGHADALATLTELAQSNGHRPFGPRKCATRSSNRDLVEFLVAIPPDQLKRPGESRFLMRRALHIFFHRKCCEAHQGRRGPLLYCHGAKAVE